MRNMDIKTYKVRQNIIRLIFPFKSLNNVHEPRNAEFKAFLGSFLVE